MPARFSTEGFDSVFLTFTFCWYNNYKNNIVISKNISVITHSFRWLQTHEISSCYLIYFVTENEIRLVYCSCPYPFTLSKEV